MAIPRPELMLPGAPAISLYTLGILVPGVLLFVSLIRDFVVWWRLRHIPGPFLNSITVLVLMRQVFRKKSAWYFTELSDKYGPIVRISPGEVMITSGEALRNINAVKSEYKRGPFFTAFRFVPGKDNLFSTQDDAYHTYHRGRLAPGYAGRENDGYDISIDKQLARFVDLVERRYVATSTSPGCVMDFHDMSHFFPLDVIGDVALGEPFGYLDQGEDLFRFVAINGQFFIYAVTLACKPSLLGLLQKWPLKSLMPKEANPENFGIVRVSTEIIDRRLQPGSKPGRDMLQALINAGLTRDELIQESIVQIVAGTDTVGSTLRMTVACLLGNPGVYKRVVEEIDARVADGTLSSPATDAQCRSLPYFQAVIKESMRMYPPLTALAFKQVPRGGDVIDGYYLPEGTQVGQNIHGILRDKVFWGENANDFVPERWLDVDAARAKDMAALLNLNFGYGKFKCLGQKVALAEINKFFVEFLRRYEFAAANIHHPFDVAAAFGWPVENFLLRITKR